MKFSPASSSNTQHPERRDLDSSSCTYSKPLEQRLAHSTQYLLNEWGNEDQAETGKPKEMKKLIALKGTTG